MGITRTTSDLEVGLSGPVDSNGRPPAPTAHRADRPSLCPPPGVDYYHAYSTPQFRRWKAVAALATGFAGWFLIGGVLIGAVGPAIDILLGTGSVELLLEGRPWMSPVMFAGNNLSIGFLIVVCLVTQRIWMGLSPRWSLSVDGKLHATFTVRLLLLCLFAFAVLEAWRFYHSGAWEMGDSKYAAFLVSIALTTPLQAAGEEFTFRGILPRILTSLFGSSKIAFVAAVLLSNVAFMAIHGATNLWLNAYYFLFGLALTFLAWRVGSIVPGIVIHAANNIAAMVLAFYWEDGDRLYERGAGSGSPLMLLPTIGTLLVVIAVAILGARRAGLPRLTPTMSSDRTGPHEGGQLSG